MAFIIHRPAVSHVASRGAARSAGAAPVALGGARTAAARLPGHRTCCCETAAVRRKRDRRAHSFAVAHADRGASAKCERLRHVSGWMLQPFPVLSL
eukprot:357218-Chlamydomonas_euryale.AAC.13